MPLYEYECPKDGRFELIRSFSDPPLKKCPKCGKPVEKLASAPAFHLKGTGWYVTDYANKGKGKSGDEGKSESKSEGTSEGKSDSKSESKSESKSDSKDSGKSDGKSSDSKADSGKSKESGKDSKSKKTA